jgi:hypothetical protein
LTYCAKSRKKNQKTFNQVPQYESSFATVRSDTERLPWPFAGTDVGPLERDLSEKLANGVTCRQQNLQMASFTLLKHILFSIGFWMILVGI